MSFDSPHNLYFLLLLPFLFLAHKKTGQYSHIFSDAMRGKIIKSTNQEKLKVFFLFASIVCLIVALARPIIKDTLQNQKQPNLSFMVALDISKSMLAKDVKPNRFEFTKTKMQTFLDLLKGEKVGIVGFSDETYLITPFSNDLMSIAYLIEHTKIDTSLAKGTDFLEMLYQTNKLFVDQKEKPLIIFSDGGDQKSFQKEIAYAKQHGITIFVYGIGTKRGSKIVGDDGIVQLDKSGNIVISSLNSGVKELALQTGGAYLEYSHNPKDLQIFLDAILEKFALDKKEEEIVISNNEELFFIPLLFSLLFFGLSISPMRLRGES